MHATVNTCVILEHPNYIMCNIRMSLDIIQKLLLEFCTQRILRQKFIEFHKNFDNLHSFKNKVTNCTSSIRFIVSSIFNHMMKY